MDTFKSSRPAVLELAGRYRDIVTELQQKRTLKGAQSQEEFEAAEEVLFREMCEICLWGNATDLSLLTNLSYEDIQKLQGSEARKNSEKNILVNDLDKAFKTLTAAKKAGKKERRVDIVLDNAGFELFVDLILGGYLLYRVGRSPVLVPALDEHLRGRPAGAASKRLLDSSGKLLASPKERACPLRRPQD